MNGPHAQKAAWRKGKNRERGARQERQRRRTQQTQSASPTITPGQSSVTQMAALLMVISPNGQNGHLRTIYVQASAQSQTRSLYRPALDGATILRTEETLARPRNQDLKKETAQRASRVLSTVSGSNGEDGAIAPRAAALEPKSEADPKRFSMQTRQIAGSVHATVDWSAKERLQKNPTALFNAARSAVGASGPPMALVRRSAAAQSRVEPENRPSQRMPPRSLDCHWNATEKNR